MVILKKERTNSRRKNIDMKKLLIIFFLLPLLVIGQLKGKVVKVKDGDTIVILDSTNTQYTIRVADIDCPERGQPYSKVAKDFVIQKIAGKVVNVLEKNRDRYGRIVGFVKYNGKDLSEELLKHGYAWHYKYFSDDITLAALEKKAKKYKVGLWIEPNPVNPYMWRKQQKNK